MKWDTTTSATLMKRVMDTAERASSLKPEATSELIKAFGGPDSGVRYWAVSGILMRGSDAVNKAGQELHQALGDASPYVRAVAAEALARYGDEADLKRAVDLLLSLAFTDTNGAFVSLWVLDIIDSLGPRAAPIAVAVKVV